MGQQDQEQSVIRVRFSDGLEETRYVPGEVGDCVRLLIAWRPEPVTFERNYDGIYVEAQDSECSEDEPRQSSNARAK